MITETQGLLKKAARTTADPTDILRWFGELNRRLQPKAKIRRTWQLPVTDGTEEYSLAVADYPIHALNTAKYLPTGATTGQNVDVLPVDALWTDGIRLQEALPGETAHTLWVYPTTYAGTMYLHGELKLLPLTNEETSSPMIREDFHDLYPLFAAARFGGQDEDFAGDGRFANYMRDFLGREAEFEAAMKAGTGPRFVRRRG